MLQDHGGRGCGVQMALLRAFAKDAYPTCAGGYVLIVFENHALSFDVHKQHLKLNMWDTSGSSYYDKVRPLSCPDSDTVFICFYIS